MRLACNFVAVGKNSNVWNGFCTCVKLNITMDTMLKFDANANFDFDAKCERILMAMAGLRSIHIVRKQSLSLMY